MVRRCAHDYDFPRVATRRSGTRLPSQPPPPATFPCWCPALGRTCVTLPVPREWQGSTRTFPASLCLLCYLRPASCSHTSASCPPTGGTRRLLLSSFMRRTVSQSVRSAEGPHRPVPASCLTPPPSLTPDFLHLCPALPTTLSRPSVCALDFFFRSLPVSSSAAKYAGLSCSERERILRVAPVAQSWDWMRKLQARGERG